MAAHVPEQVPVYLLFEPFTPQGDTPESVEQLAAEYLKALLEVQPQGPYRMVGFSVGCQLAVEMAQRLNDRGAKVDLLVLCEPPLLDAALFYRQRARLARIAIRSASRPWQRAQRLAGMALESAMLRCTNLAFHLQVIAARRFKGGNYSAETLRWMQERYYATLYKSYAQAPWSGDTVLFLPESEAPNLEETRDFWSRYFTGRLAMLLVKGAQSHRDLVDESGGAAIAKQVARLLDGKWPREDQHSVGG